MGNLVFQSDTSFNQINIPEMKTDLKEGMRKQDINLTKGIDTADQLKEKIKTIAFASYQEDLLDNKLAEKRTSRNINLTTGRGFQYSISDN
jgi:hypothetical protein